MLLTVREALGILQAHQVTSSEQMVRRWLREGRLQGAKETRRSGWRIEEKQVLGFLLEMARQGTPYEAGIDDATRIARFHEEVLELREEIQRLQEENEVLRQRLGEPSF